MKIYRPSSTYVTTNISNANFINCYETSITFLRISKKAIAQSYCV